MISGSGNYQNNSIISIYSNDTGEIIFTYSANGSLANESVKTITIFFDLDSPQISLSNNQYTLVGSNTANETAIGVTFSNKSSFLVSCSDNQSLNDISIIHSNNGTYIFSSNSQFSYLFYTKHIIDKHKFHFTN